VRDITVTVHQAWVHQSSPWPLPFRPWFRAGGTRLRNLLSLLTPKTCFNPRLDPSLGLAYECAKTICILVVLSLPCLPQVTINDVSRLNPVKVRQVISVTDIEQIKQAMKIAAERHWKLSIAGKRHSQGEHTAVRDGVVLDMTTFNRILKLDRSSKIITVESGTTWAQIQDYVNPFGLALEVQQSSNIFTVGGSLSVNAHGRDPRFGPVIETVRGFRLLRADGTVVNVSRTGNDSALFSLVIGGYGLFGVILDVDLQLTENDVYKKRCARLSYKSYPEYFTKKVQHSPAIGLHYARASISRFDYLQRMLVCSFEKTGQRPAGVFHLMHEAHIERNRRLVEMSRKSQPGKDVLWLLQETFADNPVTTVISRNNAMRPEVAFLEYSSPRDTDILQEYFVPIPRFTAFMDAIREIFLRNKVNLLNLTVRYVPKNTESFLSYSRQDSFAIVLYINQPLSDAGKAHAIEYTRELTEAVLQNGGTYYLPYQLYAAPSQLRAAYPQFDEFLSRKREYDPQELFDSGFHEHYRAGK